MARTKTTPQPTNEPTTRRPTRRNSRGLTTLEWLLIVAAVAGLAALAVVLVQNVVDETAEQIGQGSARLTAAKVAATTITDDADELKIKQGDAEGANPPSGVDKRNDLKARCERLAITYGNELAVTNGVLWTDYVSDTEKAKCKVTGKDE